MFIPNSLWGGREIRGMERRGSPTTPPPAPSRDNAIQNSPGGLGAEIRLAATEKTRASDILAGKFTN